MNPCWLCTADMISALGKQHGRQTARVYHFMKSFFQTEVALYRVEVHASHSEHMLVSQPCSKGASLACDLFPPPACKHSTQIFERIAVNAWKRRLAFIKKNKNFGNSQLCKFIPYSHTCFTLRQVSQQLSQKLITPIKESSVTWFNGRLGSARLKVGLDLRGLLHPKCF